MKQLYILLFAVTLCAAQSTISGHSTLSGVNAVGGSSQYTSVWAFAPPNAGTDHNTFVADVMPQAAVDGISILVNWSSIETGYDATPCGSTPADQCQPDPMLANVYHHYSWSAYDSTSSGNPLIYWLTTSFGGIHKKANLLITGAIAGAINVSTPSYVTGATWVSLFSGSYARQDVINYALDSCSPWTGTQTGVASGITMIRNSTTGLVTVTWSGHPYSSDDTIYGYGFTPSDYAPRPGTGVSNPMSGSFQYLSQCSSGCSNSSGPTTYGNLISKAQSYPVPYEYPYKSALMAFWASVVAHYGPGFTVSGVNYYPQLNYFRFGGSVGSEWYPYCTANLASLATPYAYVKSGSDSNHVGWLDYYQEMSSYLQSLNPAVKVVSSINSATDPTTSTVDYTFGNLESGYAVTYANGFGQFNGFGSQGVSARDYVYCSLNNCDTPPLSPPYNSASNWHPMFLQYRGTGVPLELQQAAISWPGDTMCANSCGFGNGFYAGDLPTFLNLAVDAGLTDIEIYWRDLELAYGDTGYCTLAFPDLGSCASGIGRGAQLTDAMQQETFFKNSGVGSSCGSTQGTGATGMCRYGSAINAAHGAH